MNNTSRIVTLAVIGTLSLHAETPPRPKLILSILVEHLKDPATK